MAVYTPLSDRELRQHARAFRLGKVVRSRGVSAGTINTIYDLSTSRGRFILRILENRAVSDARFEEALLGHLSEKGLPVPEMVNAGRRGRVITLGPRQHLSVFRYVPGRELAVFEVAPSHAEQIGIFLGRMHVAGKSLRRRRRSRFDPERVANILSLCMDAPVDRSVARDTRTLRSELQRQGWDPELPRGIIHSDLFIDNARFVRGRLEAVLDFEMACVGPLAYDLAVALNDWAILQDDFRGDNARALVGGYQSVRSLEPLERRELYGLCRLAAARFAITRLFDFEVTQVPGVQRLYKDYRHFMARLEAWKKMGKGTFSKSVLGTGARGR